MSIIETDTMDFKLYILLTKTSFIFLRSYFIFPQLISQIGNSYVLNLIQPSSQKFPPIPHYWVSFSDFIWKLCVLVFPTFLYIYFFHLGSKHCYCAKTLHGCLVFTKFPSTLIKIQSKPSN